MVSTSDYEYQVGGSLPVDAPSYVKRQADQDFYNGLKEGEFCYVLNARQMGKSSLRVRTAQRLQAEGVTCGWIDLTEIGTQGVTLEQWYAGVIRSLVSSFNLTGFNWRLWWRERDMLSPVQRLSEFFEEELLVRFKNLVIFVDEIDSILSLNFSSDDFFALIRSCYNKRVDNPNYKRLTFALLGVATPSDLIQDKSRTPFNIGRAIDLKGFKSHEISPLLLGLSGTVKNPSSVMREILKWTGGQPFLTQKLCRLVQSSNSIFLEKNEDEGVQQIVQSYLIDNWEYQDEPEHLRTIRDRILRNENQTNRLLALYLKILQQGEIKDEKDNEQMELRLTGLVVCELGKIRVYNQIYQTVFDINWVKQSLSDLRPYTEAFNAWIASGGQDDSRLLRRKALWEALIWAESRSLSDFDYQFLNASHELNRRSISHFLFAKTIAYITPLEIVKALVLILLSWQLSIQEWFLDQRVYLQARYRQLTHQVETTQSSPVLIIAIGEESIRKAGISDPRPMDRHYLAEIINQLNRLNIKVIGLDYLIDRPANDQGDNDQILAQAVEDSIEQNQTWFIFASKRKQAQVWWDVIDRVAQPEWSLHGDMQVLGDPPTYVSVLPIPDPDSQQRLPLSYLLALGYWMNFEILDKPPQPQLDSTTSFLSQLKAHVIDTTGDNYQRVFSAQSNLHSLTNQAYLLRQWWLQPIIDYSISPDKVYRLIPAWQLLDEPSQIPQLSNSQVVLIAPWGYGEAGIDTEGEDNYPSPSAIKYWRSQRIPTNTRPVFPGGEVQRVFPGSAAHAYMVHHFVNRRLVIPIPDSWMVLIAILLAKGMALVISQYPFMRTKLGILLLISATVIYGLVSLQLYITAAILFPYFFPTVTFWIFLYIFTSILKSPFSYRSISKPCN